MEIIKNSFKVSINLPKKDFTGFDYVASEIQINTEFRPAVNTFTFKCNIPKYIFDVVADSDIKYFTNPPKPEHYFERKDKKFTTTLSAPTLDGLLKDLQNICSDALSTKERETAQTEKYIAIKFKQSNSSQKDNFNFASMGFLTNSSFQFFVVHKIIKSPHSLDRYNFKSNVTNRALNSPIHNKHKDGWYYFGIGVVEQFQLIKWTQEREDFLKDVQNKFVLMNEKLETFLGDIDDDKIIELMSNAQFLLGDGK